MMNKNIKIPFDLINSDDYIWRTPRHFKTIKAQIGRCPKCNYELKQGFSLIPVSEDKKAKVPGMECVKCSVLYIKDPNPVKRLLIGNKSAKEFNLDGEYYWNYIQKRKQERWKEKYQKRYQRKIEILRNVSSGIILVTIESDGVFTDYVICQKKDDLLTASNNQKDQTVKVFHYSHPTALELLTGLYRKTPDSKRTLYGREYRIKGVYPKELSESFPESIMPTSVQIKPGGGYSHYIKNRRWEIIDLLMFSPFTQRYEIVHATFDNSTEECYFDITIYRSFVNRFGNPGINIWAPSGNRRNYSLSFEDLNDESLIHAYGYNASSTDGLSDRERQNLLAELVDLNLITVERIVKHLIFCIKTHTKDYEAQEKWEKDMEFIMNYKVNPERFMILKS